LHVVVESLIIFHTGGAHPKNFHNISPTSYQVGFSFLIDRSDTHSLTHSLNPPHNPKQPTNQPINQPTNQPSDQPTNQPTSQPTNHTTDQPINQPTNQSSNQSTNQSISQSAHQSTNQSVNQSTNQPTKCFTFSPLLMGVDLSLKTLCAQITGPHLAPQNHSTQNFLQDPADRSTKVGCLILGAYHIPGLGTI